MKIIVGKISSKDFGNRISTIAILRVLLTSPCTGSRCFGGGRRFDAALRLFSVLDEAQEEQNAFPILQISRSKCLF